MQIHIEKSIVWREYAHKEFSLSKCAENNMDLNKTRC